MNTTAKEEYEIEEKCLLDDDVCCDNKYVYCSQYTCCPFKIKIYKLKENESEF